MATATATATKNRLNRSQQARGMKSQGAMDMTRNGQTFYQPGIIDAAKKAGVGILVMQGGEKVLTRARSVHRTLTDTFTFPHEKEGKGKFINNSAFSEDGLVVTGAQNVNPYLDEDKCYGIIVRALMSFIDAKILHRMVADLKTSRKDGQHLVWRGKEVTSELVTAEVLWDRACSLNPDLPKLLRQNKSQRQNVSAHKSPFEKFVQNIDVMRRARSIFYPLTGELDEPRGGATPDAFPLSQCGFAIDELFLTDEIDDEGTEYGQSYYRLTIGRGTPWSISKGEWRGADRKSRAAYHPSVR